MKIYDELVWRGLIKDVSSPDLEEKLNNGELTSLDRKSTRLNSSHSQQSRMPSSA